MKKHFHCCGYYNDKINGRPSLFNQTYASFDDLNSLHISNRFTKNEKVLHKQSSLPLTQCMSDTDSTCVSDSLTVGLAEPELQDQELHSAASEFCLAGLSDCSSGYAETVRTKQITFHLKEGQMVPQLKQPKGLYALGYDLSQQYQPRWPEDMQVIKEKIVHIPYVPREREPLYKQTYVELQPPVVGDTKGRVVFCYKPLAAAYFIRSCIGASALCEDAAVPLIGPGDTTLLFESRFECGNLEKVIQISEFIYELYLRQDLYCDRHTQWFYFQVKNTKPGLQYRFNIVNLRKPNSLYNSGMKPLMYSEKSSVENKVGWHRVGHDICYFRNNLPSRGDVGPAYSLTFTVEFPYENDTVYFANCYPYTYSNLQDYLLDLQSNEAKSAVCKQRILCRSIAGNLVPVLTITSGGTSINNVKKRVVMVTARVHPGETSASWVCKGLIDFLTSNTQEAEILRSQFIFKVIPMLNPDGVIVGNYRCCLAGRDLNRQYRTALKNGFPSIWYTKHFVMRLMEEHEIFVYCDIHGHSRKHNMFIYGCENKQESPNFLHERIFPFLLKKYAVDKFSQDSSKYKIERCREGTGRVVMWRLGITNSFTLEATLGGCTQGRLAGYHFTTADFESMGKHFCEALLEYGMADVDKIAELRFAVELQLQQQQYSSKSGGRSSASVSQSSDDRDSESSETESLSVGVGKLNLKVEEIKGIRKQRSVQMPRKKAEPLKR